MAELRKKLQVKQGDSLVLLNAPEAVAQVLAQEGCAFTRADEEAPGAGACHAVLLFVQHAAQLNELGPQAVALLQPKGMLWIAYPKQSSGVTTDLSRDKGWQSMKALGFEVVRQVAVDEVWSALRFRHQSERLQSSAFGVDKPGIDRRTKAVAIPGDLEEALVQEGMLGAFERMAFTHRKEYVVAVLEAKKPETRARRIAKAVEGAKNQAQGKG